MPPGSGRQERGRARRLGPGQERHGPLRPDPPLRGVRGAGSTWSEQEIAAAGWGRGGFGPASLHQGGLGWGPGAAPLGRARRQPSEGSVRARAEKGNGMTEGGREAAASPSAGFLSSQSWERRSQSINSQSWCYTQRRQRRGRGGGPGVQLTSQMRGGEGPESNRDAGVSFRPEAPKSQRQIFRQLPPPAPAL